MCPSPGSGMYNPDMQCRCKGHIQGYIHASCMDYWLINCCRCLSRVRHAWETVHLHESAVHRCNCDDNCEGSSRTLLTWFCLSVRWARSSAGSFCCRLQRIMELILTHDHNTWHRLGHCSSLQDTDRQMCKWWSRSCTLRMVKLSAVVMLQCCCCSFDCLTVLQTQHSWPVEVEMQWWKLYQWTSHW